MNFHDAMEYINGFSHSGKKVTDLSRIRKLMNMLGNPQNDLKFVHIAGTNGKGSVLEYISNALIAEGYKTGQFTSPFINNYCDRIRINNNWISEAKVAEICNIVMGKVDSEEFSQFEITFAIAMIYFKSECTDIVILETGIGGLLDATNVIPSPLISVITSVSLDHTSILGDTVEKIAYNKSGIIKNGCQVVLSADNVLSVKKIISEVCQKNKCKLTVPEISDLDKTEINLEGNRFEYKNRAYHTKMCGYHQIINALSAIEVLKILDNCGYSISNESIEYSLENVSIGSRIEVISENPMVILDGGHNSAGIDSLVKILEDIKNKSFVGVIGMVKGKDLDYAVKNLSPFFEKAYCVDGFIENNFSSEILAKKFAENNCSTEKYEYSEGFFNALEYAKEHDKMLLVCGSLYLCSAIRKIIK